MRPLGLFWSIKKNLVQNVTYITSSKYASQEPFFLCSLCNFKISIFKSVAKLELKFFSNLANKKCGNPWAIFSNCFMKFQFKIAGSQHPMERLVDTYHKLSQNQSKLVELVKNFNDILWAAFQVADLRWSYWSTAWSIQFISWE